jgi:hypothetical protein
MFVLFFWCCIEERNHIVDLISLCVCVLVQQSRAGREDPRERTWVVRFYLAITPNQHPEDHIASPPPEYIQSSTRVHFEPGSLPLGSHVSGERAVKYVQAHLVEEG